MYDEIDISIVIPTYNRKPSLLRLLASLNKGIESVREVLIVDASEEKLETKELTGFSNLHIQYIQSEPSVCIQRNIGIQKAKGNWIFLCDDDLEVPVDYLSQLSDHIKSHAAAGAVSGLVLQKENNDWIAQYPVTSSVRLLLNFIFQLSMWGEIKCSSNNPLISKIKQYYSARGNHISKAGWPVLTDLSGDYFRTPVYGLGASVVKKEWLINSPYDEILDKNGIGDNYGVAIGFPAEGIHILTNAFVYHHLESVNRAPIANRYGRRVLAIHYFIKSSSRLKHVSTYWLLWSLLGSSFLNLLARNFSGSAAGLKSISIILVGRNPYLLRAKKKTNV